MRRIIIDCGGHLATSVDMLKKAAGYDANTVIYSFEPNPRCFWAYDNRSDVILVKAAVWTHDGFETLHRRTRCQGKTCSLVINDMLGTGRDIKVPCISLSRWMLDNTREDDEVILKMDIEAAEYEVIPSLLNTGLFKRIRTAYIEWHHRPEDRDRLIRGIKAQNPDIGLYGAIEREPTLKQVQ